MRNLFFTGLFALMASIGFSQNVQPSSKVNAGFDKASLKALNDSQLEYWNFYAQNSYIVHDEAKSTELPLLSSVLKPGKPAVSGTITQENFNPFNYAITPLQFETQLFLIDGTNKMVQIHSQSTIDQYFDNYQVNQAKLKRLKK